MDNYDIGYKDGYFAGLSKKEELSSTKEEDDQQSERVQLSRSGIYTIPKTEENKDASYHEGYSKGLLDAKNNQPKNNISINYPPLDWTDEIEEQ